MHLTVKEARKYYSLVEKVVGNVGYLQRPLENIVCLQRLMGNVVYHRKRNNHDEDSTLVDMGRMLGTCIRVRNLHFHKPPDDSGIGPYSEQL